MVTASSASSVHNKRVQILKKGMEYIKDTKGTPSWIIPSIKTPKNKLVWKEPAKSFSKRFIKPKLKIKSLFILIAFMSVELLRKSIQSSGFLN